MPEEVDPGQNVQAGSVDVSSLPADVQAYIAEQVAKAVAAATAEPAPHVDTPDEKLDAAVGKVANSSPRAGEFDAIADAFAELVAYVRAHVVKNGGS